jgi:hypothetical protein
MWMMHSFSFLSSFIIFQDGLCNHGGQAGRLLFGRRGVDCILSAFRSPALDEEVVSKNTTTTMCCFCSVSFFALL